MSTKTNNDIADELTPRVREDPADELRKEFDDRSDDCQDEENDKALDLLYAASIDRSDDYLTEDEEDDKVLDLIYAAGKGDYDLGIRLGLDSGWPIVDAVERLRDGEPASDEDRRLITAVLEEYSDGLAREGLAEARDRILALVSN